MILLLLLGSLAPFGQATGEGAESAPAGSPEALQEIQRILSGNRLTEQGFPTDLQQAGADVRPAPIDPEALEPTPLAGPQREVREGDPDHPLAIPASTHGCTNHPRIRITEDVGPDGFAIVQEPTTGLAAPRPGSGVTGGTGTPADPYVIEGWCIDLLPFVGGGPAGILIRDTDAHVVIKENTIAGYGMTGIHLERANNVSVENNRLTSLDIAVWAMRGEDLVFRGNEIEDSWDLAFLLEETKRTTVEDNIMREDFRGIYGIENEDLNILTNEVHSVVQPVILIDTTGGTFHGNDFQGYHGVVLRGVESLVVSHNTFGEWTGLYVRDSEGVSALHNSFSSSDYYAVEAVNHSNLTLSHNTLQGSGVLAYDGRGLRVDSNEFDGSLSYGLVLWDTTDAIVEHNSLHDTGYAVTLSESDVLFRENSLQDNYFGVWGIASSDQDMIFENNTIRGGHYAIALSGGNHLEASRNRIEDHFSMGLYVSSFTSTDIQDNEIHSNGISGIQVSRTLNTTINENNVSGHHAIGIIVNYPVGEPGRPFAHIAEDDGVQGDDHGEDDPGGPDGMIRIEDNLLNDNGYGILAQYGEVHVHGNQLLSHDGQEITVTNARLGAVSDNEVALVDSARIFVGDSRDMDIKGNTLSSSLDQLVLSASTDLTIQNNTLFTGGILLDGENRPHFTHTMDGSNTVGGRSVLYILDEEDVEVAGDPGQVILVGAHRAKVEGLHIDGGLLPLQIVASDDVQVSGSTFTGAQVGIYVLRSDRLVLSGNQLEDLWAGALLWDTTGATLTNNTFQDNLISLGGFQTPRLQATGTLIENASLGIVLFEAVGATLGPSTIQSEDGLQGVYIQGARGAQLYGLDISGYADALVIEASRDVTLEDSRLHANGAGAALVGSRGITLQGNEITDNEVGITLDEADEGGHLVTANNIHGNLGVALASHSPFSVDARENWWGCPAGPDAADCDIIEGDVDVDPWLTEPVPDAGP